MKTKLIVIALCIVPALAFAQPTGGSAPPPGSGTAAPAPAGSGTAAPAPTDPAPTPGSGTAAAPTGDATGLRKTCVDAMNADPTFAQSVLQKAYEVEAMKCDLVDAVAAKKRLELDLAQHDKAATAIAKNQKHVILAYAAMWLVAAAFVLFLWRRQQLLRREIAQLKADLDAATKDTK